MADSKEMLNITINGKAVTVPAGSNLIDAFKNNEEEIAHYCYHPGLSIAGVCRLCMVEIEGNPRIQVACNTIVAEGMVASNTSEKIQETVKWGLDFHLINHPLDCPVCDQAGECELQIQYMKFGQADSKMAEKKVKKHKVVDLGEKIILDTERCILCSRCVRFTNEVSKTKELGIFNRGDRSEIGTVAGKPLDNNYSLNTVDICPVGALTSKDFRFKQRVWYLKEKESVCTGCSTGCNVKYYYNEEGVFRVKPVYNEGVNGHWMCDAGRGTYKFVNKDVRLKKAKLGVNGSWEEKSSVEALRLLGEKLSRQTSNQGGESVALILTGQHTNEEYDSLLKYFTGNLQTSNIYHWVNNEKSFDDFDGLLIRGDKNPNTKGLLASLKQYGLASVWGELESKISSGTIKTVVVAAPENISTYPCYNEKQDLFKKVETVVWLSSIRNEKVEVASKNTWFIPIKSFIEKSGSFTNHSGLKQTFEKVLCIVKDAVSLSDAALIMEGQDVKLDALTENYVKTNFFTQEKGQSHEFS